MMRTSMVLDNSKQDLQNQGRQIKLSLVVKMKKQIDFMTITIDTIFIVTVWIKQMANPTSIGLKAEIRKKLMRHDVN